MCIHDDDAYWDKVSLFKLVLLAALAWLGTQVGRVQRRWHGDT
jgi:hypothetical protein